MISPFKNNPIEIASQTSPRALSHKIAAVALASTLILPSSEASVPSRSDGLGALKMPAATEGAKRATPLTSFVSADDQARVAGLVAEALTEEGAKSLLSEREPVRRLVLQRLVAKFFNEAEQAGELHMEKLTLFHAHRRALGAALGSIDPLALVDLNLSIKQHEKGYRFFILGASKNYAEGVRSDAGECRVEQVVEIPAFNAVWQVMARHTKLFGALIRGEQTRVESAVVKDLGQELAQALRIEKLQSAHIGEREFNIGPFPGSGRPGASKLPEKLTSIVILLRTSEEEIRITATDLPIYKWDFKVFRVPVSSMSELSDGLKIK